MQTLNDFYRSKEWTRLVARLRIERADENGIVKCELCGEPILKRYDCIGHHRVNLTEDNVNDATVALNPENIMLVHFRCHNRLHQRWNFSKRKPQEVVIVWGSPKAGKATFVQQNATENDLIVDVNAIRRALTTGQNNRTTTNVLGVRDFLIDQIRMRAGKWETAYIIGGYPMETERNRLAEMLRARTVFIDTDKDTCMARCETDQEREYVADWWERYVPPCD